MQFDNLTLLSLVTIPQPRNRHPQLFNSSLPPFLAQSAFPFSPFCERRHVLNNFYPKDFRRHFGGDFGRSSAPCTTRHRDLGKYCPGRLGRPFKRQGSLQFACPCTQKDICLFFSINCTIQDGIQANPGRQGYFIRANFTKQL